MGSVVGITAGSPKPPGSSPVSVLSGKTEKLDHGVERDHRHDHHSHGLHQGREPGSVGLDRRVEELPDPQRAQPFSGVHGSLAARYGGPKTPSAMGHSAHPHAQNTTYGTGGRPELQSWLQAALVPSGVGRRHLCSRLGSRLAWYSDLERDERGRYGGKCMGDSPVGRPASPSSCRIAP